MDLWRNDRANMACFVRSRSPLLVLSHCRQTGTRDRGTVQRWRSDRYVIPDRCAILWYVQAIIVYDDGTGVDKPVRNQKVG